jgi:hypothetical protein
VLKTGAGILLRFYTPADRPKSLFDLYQIQSVTDYVESINSLELDAKSLISTKCIHSDYEFIEEYICSLIETASRVVFLGVYDFSKEVYFVNRFPNQRFLVGDVSSKALQSLEGIFDNVVVTEATFDQFNPVNGDVVIINIAEYLMSKQEMLQFVGGSADYEVILNNAHVYRPSFSIFFSAFVRECRAGIVNLLSLLGRHQQWQFRGWWRTERDYVVLAKTAGKVLKAVKVNPNRKFGHKGHSANAAMVHIGRADR